MNWGERTRQVQDVFTARGWTLSLAESCTGGALSAQLVSQPDCSAYYLGGVVSYGNAAKAGLLGVPQSLLLAHGAVSVPVVRAMAQGARRRFDSTWALSVSGVAGPQGGSPDKPVGTVCFGLCGPGFEWQSQQQFAELKREDLRSRQQIIDASVTYALQTLLERVKA